MATSIRLDPAIEQRLDHLATATGRTKAFYLRQLVVNGLDDLEDLYMAERELEAIRAGESTTVPLEEVMKRHGMGTPTAEIDGAAPWQNERKRPPP